MHHFIWVVFFQDYVHKNVARNMCELILLSNVGVVLLSTFFSTAPISPACLPSLVSENSRLLMTCCTMLKSIQCNSFVCRIASAVSLCISIAFRNRLLELSVLFDIPWCSKTAGIFQTVPMQICSLKYFCLVAWTRLVSRSKLCFKSICAILADLLIKMMW